MVRPISKRIKRGDVSPKEVATTTRLQKQLRDYSATSGGAVKAARYYNEHFGGSLGEGDSVNWVYVHQAPEGMPPIDVVAYEKEEQLDNFALNYDLMVEKLIKATQSRDIPVLAFTALNKDLAGKLMARLGLDAMGVELIIPEEVKDSFPRADDWLKMLKQTNKERSTLVAVVSSQVACKGALTAGAACIAVPDEYTAFQDYSGAKMVLDSLADEKPDSILDLTLRM